MSDNPTVIGPFIVDHFTDRVTITGPAGDGADMTPGAARSLAHVLNDHADAVDQAGDMPDDPQ